MGTVESSPKPISTPRSRGVWATFAFFMWVLEISTIYKVRTFWTTAHLDASLLYRICIGVAWVEVDVLFLTRSSRHARFSKVLGSQAWQQKPVIPVEIGRFLKFEATLIHKGQARLLGRETLSWKNNKDFGSALQCLPRLLPDVISSTVNHTQIKREMWCLYIVNKNVSNCWMVLPGKFQSWVAHSRPIKAMLFSSFDSTLISVS